VSEVEVAEILYSVTCHCEKRIRDQTQPEQHVAFIYKIVTAEQWRIAERDGVFTGAPIDLTDGYIHFSTARQVRETAAKHFAGQGDLLLVAIPTASIEDTLKWEVSRGGALFPHLYATLDPKLATWVKPLPLGVDGKHAFPDLVA
jgi:uncharacterized protein (DUF952 family)